VGVSTDVKAMDPHLSSGGGVWRAQLTSLYDTALMLDPVDLALKPSLVKTWEWADLKTLKLTVQDGVTFHNGARMTAEDLKWNIDRVRDPKVGSTWISGWTTVDSVTVDDPLHLTIKLKQASVGLPFQMTYLWIMPKGGDPTAAVGTGPFALAEYVPNSTLRLKRNPSYWRQGQPYLDELVFKVLPEIEARYAALAAGDIDLAYDIPMKDVPRMSGTRGTVVAAGKPADQHFVVHVNTTREPLNNKKLRQALAWSLDRVTFMKEFTGGIGRPGSSPIPPGHWAYSERVDKYYGYDLAKAKALLADAGFAGGKGLRPLTFLAAVGYPEFMSGSEMLQAALGSIGIQTRIETLDVAAWLKRIAGRDYDLSWDYPGRGAGDPDFLFKGVVWGPGERNWWGIDRNSLPTYVDGVTAGGATTDQKERMSQYAKALEAQVEFAAPLVVGQRALVSAHRDYVKGFIIHPLQLVTYGPVWVEK
jgi:peptide/nickel transport system substrate-binding protein